MDSLWMERNLHRNSETGASLTMETDDLSSRSNKSNTPTWKMPISKSVSSALSDRLDRLSSESSSSGNNSDERDEGRQSSPDYMRRQGKSDKEDEDTLIQILLPCIICNRTFSPEALERHSKVCTKVNIKTPYKPDRGKFDTSVYRKKGTRLEDFIPPPSLDSRPDNRFSRGSKNRSSLRGTSCTTRSTISTENLLFGGANNSPLTPTTPTPFRRQRSISQTRGDRASSKAPSDYPYDDHSESNSEESQTIPDTNLPSYAKPIAPTDECPYCNRAFGLKAYDRHVSYCKEKYVQRQYEIQPVPKEKIEAMERQEIRTKYRPMKGSSSCSSLRSVSPAKDFASMAYKLFGGMRRTDGSNNLYNNLTNNFKKSNESLTNSCYGDYSRGLRRPSPSPARTGIGGHTMSVTNKINNLLSKTFHPQQNNNNTVHPMRINTTSNIPKLTKSSDNLAGMTSGSAYANVPGSGYGQQSNNFSRNSRSRSSLHKNFFRSKRVEPEGTENTSTMTNTNSSSPLIITPMTFFSKTYKMNAMPHEIPRPRGTTLLTQDTSYDPYEMAAKQLEELLKAQPINKNVNKKTARKLGLEKAFESVGVHSPAFENHNEDERTHDRKGDGDQFQFDLASGKMDDSYWDEILQKSSAAHQKQQELQQASSETKSQLSDSSMGDNNSKSRAMSHISSADSGFSRSEVNDPEFEALESLVSLGEEPQPSRSKGQSQNALSSVHTSLSRIFNRKPQSQLPHQQFPRRSQSQSQEEQPQQPESPMQISPVPLQSQPDSWRKDSTTSSSSMSSSSSPSAVPSPSGARFCHECGHAYPTSIAKFCPECGEKRVFKL